MEQRRALQQVLLRRLLLVSLHPPAGWDAFCSMLGSTQATPAAKVWAGMGALATCSPQISWEEEEGAKAEQNIHEPIPAPGTPGTACDRTRLALLSSCGPCQTPSPAVASTRGDQTGPCSADSDRQAQGFNRGNESHLSCCQLLINLTSPSGERCRDAHKTPRATACPTFML